MSRHSNLLSAIFHDPISGNIHWRDVESLLHHLGASVETGHGARFRVVLNNVEGFLHHPHHGGVFSKPEVKHIRDYLAQAGVTPALYEAQKGQHP
ncbi:MAG: hypothetical protein CTY16_02445 [Methylobacter sp.]|uniref:type II toxin-antitoxin system HicA family toxin n=1 Tax=Methylovulum miyakonense TaxID=645578 RepID=UPI000D44049A|nr:MAG: hypothetical protein CTY16_02445 [Methylobacter sp.]